MGSSRERDGRTRARGEGGAALVEFSLVMILLFSILFGIIHYGLILSFKQDMTRAAAEGARAGAVAFPSADALTDAQAAAEEAVESFGGSEWRAEGCQRDGMICTITLIDCATEGPVTLATTDECVKVELFYDYDGDDLASCGSPASPPEAPLFGSLPVLGGLTEPSCVSAKSVARTNA